MKSKKIIYIQILLFVTFIGMCAIPSLCKKITYSPDDYPFVYYSSILKELCYIDFHDKETPMRDGAGNLYTTAQYDSLMPLFNFRQLMVDGRLPDSIDGHEITPPILMSKSIIYRYSPAKFKTPDVGLYMMYESMPKRVGLELPDDVFRMKDKIEFIDNASNTINTQKSQTFQQALDKAGYSFPTQWVSGNMNPHKRYDEGYFCLDDSRQLFHVKMVNGRPFVRNTHIGDSITIEGFTVYEAADKRFYGFLFDKMGSAYIIESDEGKYKALKLDIPPINLENDEMMIMGNLLYWTVSVTSKKGKDIYALKSGTLECLQKIAIERTPGKWDNVSAWLFPAYLTFEHNNSDFIYPRLTVTGYKAFAVNLALALLFSLVISNPGKKRLFNFLFVLLTGITGLIALLILPDFSTKKIKSK
ncbi:MAG: DUF4857 domain-containing protein [Tannerellaceae bacterium]|nr:DUF4857 domain-containing protein [Tannerellaceae bacterium]